MDRWKSRGGKSRSGEEPKREDQRRERLRRKKKKVSEKVGKSRFIVFFQWFVAPEGRKSRLAKARGAEPCGQMRDEKLHAVVARSIFPSQHEQNTPTSDDFWKLRCRKSARSCGAKHISKSKVLKTEGLGPLLEVETSKKRTPLWHEAHFQVKMYKAQGSEKVQMERKNRKTHWYEAVSSALNSPPLKEAPQNSFVFDVGNLKNRKCRRIALFLMLSSAIQRGSLAELLRVWCCQV